MIDNKYKRGDVLLVNLGSVNTKSGSVQYGVRPCILISNNKANTYGDVMTVVPITSASTKFKKMLPTHTILNRSNSDIKVDSIAMAEQLTIISKEQVVEKLFELNNDLLNRVDYTVLVQLGLAYMVNNQVSYAV